MRQMRLQLMGLGLRDSTRGGKLFIKHKQLADYVRA